MVSCLFIFFLGGGEGGGGARVDTVSSKPKPQTLTNPKP